MIVVDASAAIEWLLGTPAGAAVGERLFDPRETAHAPELIDLEVALVLRRYERAKLLDFADLRLERYSHRLLLPRAWELRAHLTIDDACYVALAELLDAPLLTGDATLERAVHRARIERLGAG